MLHEITEFSEGNFHRLFPKQFLEYFSFCCCKYFPLWCHFLYFLFHFLNILYIYVNFVLWRLLFSYEMTAITRRLVGRPKLPGSLKTIRLRESVFNLWRDRKEALGFLGRTDSGEFAEFLPHCRRWGLLLDSYTTCSTCHVKLFYCVADTSLQSAFEADFFLSLTDQTPVMNLVN